MAENGALVNPQDANLAVTAVKSKAHQRAALLVTIYSSRLP
jgi:hypothetical protein